MKTLVVLFLTACGTMSLIGCGKKSNNVATNVVGNCMAGQVRTATGQCLSQGTCPAGQGWNGSACVAGTIISPNTVYGGNGILFSNTLQITSRDTFERFLEGMGLCSYSGYYAEEYGPVSGPNPMACRTFSDKGYVSIQFFPQASQFDEAGNVPAFVTIGAGVINPNHDPYSANSLQAPLNMTTFIVNNNTGFDLYVRGSFNSGLSSEVSLRTETGNYMTNANFETKLRYNGVEFASTFVNRL